MKPRTPFRGVLRLITAAAVSGLILAALFHFIPPAEVWAGDLSSSAGPASEKTPIDLSQTAPKPGEPAAKNLFLDGAAKLLLVLAAVFALFWVLRRFQPAGFGTPSPGGPFEIAALVGLSAKSRLALVRFGERLLLLSVGAERTEKLAETTDPDEIARILASLKRKGAEK